MARRARRGIGKTAIAIIVIIIIIAGAAAFLAKKGDRRLTRLQHQLAALRRQARLEAQLS